MCVLEFAYRASRGALLPNDCAAIKPHSIVAFNLPPKRLCYNRNEGPSLAEATVRRTRDVIGADASIARSSRGCAAAQ
jgi:hypothetical protein